MVTTPLDYTTWCRCWPVYYQIHGQDDGANSPNSCSYQDYHLHGSLALILDDADCATVTKNIIVSTANFDKPKNNQPKHQQTLQPIQNLDPPRRDENTPELRNSVWRKSMKITLVMPIRPSWCSSIISARIGARSWCRSALMQWRPSLKGGSPQPPTSSRFAINSTNNGRSAWPSTSSSQRKAKLSTLMDKCTRATTIQRSKWPSMKCRWTWTSHGQIQCSFSPKSLPNTRATAMTVQPTADLTVWHTSTMSQPLATWSAPPATSPPATFTSRASKNHSQITGVCCQGTHPYPRQNRSGGSATHGTQLSTLNAK